MCCVKIVLLYRRENIYLLSPKVISVTALFCESISHYYASCVLSVQMMVFRITCGSVAEYSDISLVLQLVSWLVSVAVCTCQCFNLSTGCILSENLTEDCCAAGEKQGAAEFLKLVFRALCLCWDRQTQDLHIDWILFRGRPLVPALCEVINDNIDGVYPSSHFPIFAEFLLPRSVRLAETPSQSVFVFLFRLLSFGLVLVLAELFIFYMPSLLFWKASLPPFQKNSSSCSLSNFTLLGLYFFHSTGMHFYQPGELLFLYFTAVVKSLICQ